MFQLSTIKINSICIKRHENLIIKEEGWCQTRLGGWATSFFLFLFWMYSVNKIMKWSHTHARSGGSNVSVSYSYSISTCTLYSIEQNQINLFFLSSLLECSNLSSNPYPHTNSKLHTFQTIPIHHNNSKIHFALSFPSSPPLHLTKYEPVTKCFLIFYWFCARFKLTKLAEYSQFFFSFAPLFVFLPSRTGVFHLWNWNSSPS